MKAGVRPSVARSRYGFGRPGSDGTGAVWPAGGDADRAGRDGTEPGESPPRRTAQRSGPEPATLRFGLIDRRTQEGSSRLHALLYACYPRLVNGYQLDENWEVLPEHLRRRLWGLSADLFSLVDNEKFTDADWPTSTQQEIAHRLKRTFENRQWDEFLAKSNSLNNTGSACRRRLGT